MSDKKPDPSQQAPKQVIKESGRTLPPTKLTIPMPLVKPPPPSTSGKK